MAAPSNIKLAESIGNSGSNAKLFKLMAKKPGDVVGYYTGKKGKAADKLAAAMGLLPNKKGGTSFVAKDEAALRDYVTSKAAELEKPKKVTSSYSGSIDYILDLYAPAEHGGEPVRLYTVALPQQPSEKRIRRIPAMSLKRTLGTLPIREFDSDRAWSIDLRSIQGYENRNTTNALGGMASLSGIEALLEFDKFLAHYSSLASNNSTLYLKNPEGHRHLLERTYLVFRDLEEGLAWRVEAVDWTWDRTAARTRVANAEWSLHLVAYFDDSRPGPTELKGFSAVPKGSTSKKGAIEEDGRRKLNKEAAADALFDSLFPRQVTDARGNGPYRMLTEQVPKGLLPKCKERLAALGKSFNEIRAVWNSVLQANQGLRRSVQEILEAASTPRHLLSDLVALTSNTLGIFSDIRSFGYQYGNSLHMLDVLLTHWQGDVERLFSHATAACGARAVRFPNERQQAPVPATPALFTGPRQQPPPTVAPSLGTGARQEPPVVGAVQVKVGSAKSWNDLAGKYLGSKTMGRALAEFNGALGVYAKSDGSPFLPADQVLVPAPAGAQVLKGNGPGAAYGTDLYLDPETGDLALNVQPVTVLQGGGYATTMPKAVDLMPVSGVPNFEQALRLRFLTVQGSSKLAPAYGVLPVEPGTEITRNLLALSVSGVIAQAQQDPRVLAVKQASFAFDADRLTISAEVVGVTGAQVGAAVPLAA